MKKKPLLVTALLAASALALTACSSSGGGADSGDAGDTGSGGAEGAVAMSFPGQDIAVWPLMQDKMRPVIEENGYSLVTHDPGWDIQRQVEDWQSWIARGDVKAIMGYPVQEDTIYAVTDEAVAAGIPVLGYANNWEGTSAAIIFNNYDDGFALGEEAGQWIVDNYGTDEVMPVGILGYYDSELGQERTRGIMEGVESTGANVDMTEHPVNALEDGYEAVKNQLTAAPETKVFLAFSNDSASGAYQAMIDEGIASDDQTYLLGNIDVVDETLDTVGDFSSFWNVVYAMNVTEAATAMGQMLVDAANGETVTDVEVPALRVTAENADDFRA